MPTKAELEEQHEEEIEALEVDLADANVALAALEGAMVRIRNLASQPGIPRQAIQEIFRIADKALE